MLASRQVLAEQSGSAPKAFVFPRNQLGSLRDCERLYRAYRNTPAPRGAAGVTTRLRLASGLFPIMERQYSDQIYWRGGSWKMLPDYGWKRLWRERLRQARAAGNDCVQSVHVWTHPHNLATDPDQHDRIRWLFDLFEANRPHIKFLKLSDIGPDGNDLPAAA